MLSKNGSPASNVEVRIETDNNGAPSGNLAHANATFTFTSADIDVSTAWRMKNSANLFELDANTLYWIKARCDATNASHYYIIWYVNDAKYAIYGKGNMARSTDSCATWTDYPDDDVVFRLYTGGKAETSSVTLTISYTKRYL